MKKTLTGIIIGLVVLALGWFLIDRLAGRFVNSTVSPEVAAEKIAALFKAPTQAEIDATIQDWQKRDDSSQGWKVEQMGMIEGLPTWVVSHQIDGKRHYGLVRFPENPQSGKKYPVLIYNHAGNDGVSLKSLTLLDNQFLPLGCLKEKFIYLVPTYRSEKLDAGSLGMYKSEGEPSVLDRDVDDVLGLLSGVLKNIPEANPEKVVTLGISRGGGVSLLAGVRDKRIKAVAELSGMTDFFLPSIEKESIDLYLTRRFSANPVMEVVMESVKRYLNGKTSLEEARQALLRSSAAHFVDRAPIMQIHHGALDELIPIEHSERLNQAIQDSGRSASAGQYFRYDTGEHDILSMPGSGERIENFLCPYAEETAP